MLSRITAFLNCVAEPVVSAVRHDSPPASFGSRLLNDNYSSGSSNKFQFQMSNSAPSIHHSYKTRPIPNPYKTSPIHNPYKIQRIHNPCSVYRNIFHSVFLRNENDACSFCVTRTDKLLRTCCAIYHRALTLINRLSQTFYLHLVTISLTCFITRFCSLV